MIRVEIASPPDREYLVAPLMFEHEQWAEVDQESGSLTIEFYPRRDGQPWRLVSMRLSPPYSKPSSVWGDRPFLSIGGQATTMRMA
jgi:hypothetical protein